MNKNKLFSFATLRNLVSDSMAIDLGSASTIIAVRGRGVIVDEPSVLAVHKLTGEVLAVGREAQGMQGREAREVSVIAPLVDGVVADWEYTQAMLDHFVRDARSGASHFSRRAVMSVLSGITQVEQRALLTAAERARIGRVYMVEEGLAAALGAGVSPEDQRANAVVDIGSSTTNFAAVAQGKIIHAFGEKIGGTDINAAIVNHLRRNHGLSVGAPTAELLKIELLSATVPEDLGLTRSVKGRGVQTGSPAAVEVTAGELYAVAQPIMQKMAQVVQQALTEVPPEVSADIYDRGIILTGGGALLDGLDDFLQREIKLHVAQAEEPRYAVVRGLMQMFDEPLLLRRISKQDQLDLLKAEPDAFGT